MFERLEAIVRDDPAVEEILSLQSIYTGPEEAVVVAKVRPSPAMSIEDLSRAMDELDHRIRKSLPIVADVFIDVTASRIEGAPVKIRR
jgi:divalent metal cation (Fe/Co/Zn/Cd) transporter